MPVLAMVLRTQQSTFSRLLTQAPAPMAELEAATDLKREPFTYVSGML